MKLIVGLGNPGKEYENRMIDELKHCNGINVNTSKIDFLINNPPLRKKMGTFAYHSTQKYHITNIASIWEKLFKELIESCQY